MQLNWILDNVYGLSPVSIAVAFATLFFTIVYYYLKTRGLPPGPTGVPLLGYWPFINHKQIHLQFNDLKKKYGDVFSIKITGRLYIHLGSVKAVREAHIAKSDCFTNRNEDFNLVSGLFGGGVALLNGEEWKVNRKFFMQAIKERGLLSIKDSMTNSFYESIHSTIDDLRAKNGETVNLVEFLMSKCNTIMHITLFGGREVPEEHIREANGYYIVLMSCFTATNMLLSGTLARYTLLPFASGYRESWVAVSKLEKLLYKIIDEHKSTYDEEHTRDIIDDYIKDRSVRRSKGDSTARYFTDKALMATLIQIIGDGVLSVAAFTALFIKALLDHPEEQDKIYKELVEVVGLDRQPTLADKSKLTYTNAFILEAMRTSDFFPIFPSQECTKETTLRGYRIPKGAITLPNTHAAHNDPETYDEPEKFDPTRYIATEGKRRPDLPITFGTGKRACIGEGFAMLQVFLFVTTIIQNFRISLPDGINDQADELFAAGQLRILVEPRNQK